MNRRLHLGALTLALGAALVGAATDAHAIIGRPLTPVSFAGVARRSVRRTAYATGAMYGAGMYGAGYASPAYVPALPAGCAVGMPCGGAVYQPAYSGSTVVYVQH